MIYLASTSPRRRRLLNETRFRFKCVRPPYQEKPIPGLEAKKLVCRHAEEKALSVCKQIKNGIIIGSDTVVALGKKVIGKPKNLKNASQTLRRLQNRWHWVYTGVCLLKIKNRKCVRRSVFCEKTAIRIRKMSQIEIQAYFKRINPLDKAGSYAIQSRYPIVRGIRGSFTNAVGLPMEKLVKHLRAF